MPDQATTDGAIAAKKDLRICSLLPSATEIVASLGLADRLVGVSDACDHPPAVRTLPRVVRSTLRGGLSASEIDDAATTAQAEGQTLYRIDADLLRDLRPDLVLAQDLCDVCALPPDHVREALAGLPHSPRLVLLAPERLDDVLADILRVADAAGYAQRGREVVASLRARVEAVRGRARQAARRPRVACVEWVDPVWDAGHWMPELVGIAGCEAVFGSPGPSRRRTVDDLWAAKPDVVLIAPCGFDLARARLEAARLALPAGARVYVADGNQLYSRSGPRLVNGLEYLAAMVHPELFPPTWPEWAVCRIA